MDDLDVVLPKPVAGRRRWMSGAALFDALEQWQADPGLGRELDEMQADEDEEDGADLPTA